MKWKGLRFKKISWKLTLAYAGMFSMVLILLSAGVLYSVRAYLIQQSIDEVSDTSSASQEVIIDTIKENHKLNDPEILEDIGTDTDINIKITDAHGNELISSDSFDTSELKYDTYIGITRRVEVDSAHFIVHNSEVQVDGDIKAYLQVAKNMEKEYSFIDLLLVTMGLADIVGVLLSLLAGYLISRRMLGPIDKITRTARSISISDLNTRIEVGEADDELSRLSHTFNEMIERLQLSFDKQNQFVSDASHELRTPISVIRGYIDLIDRWGKDDKVVLQESVEAIKSETRSMGDLVEKLLLLARNDAGKLSLKKEIFKVRELISEVIRQSELIAPKQAFLNESDENVTLFADREMIKQMLRALIDNSIKYSGDNKNIIIKAQYCNGETVLAVQDTGIGIPPDKIENIFDRFFRVDSARTKKTGGTGLGLSIVKMIAEAHQGRVDIQSKVGTGTTVSVFLPAEKPNTSKQLSN